MKQSATPILRVPFVFLLLLLSIQARSENPNPNPSSAYEELKSNGFPAGLLPANVRGYILNRTSGEFAVDLGGCCRVTLPPDGYLAAYSTRITGRLLHRRISRLDGIRVRAFFRWWSIDGIRSAGDDLVFEVGPVSAKYSSSNFRESPDCEGPTTAAAAAA